jgi:penicillin-binding protein-related factor A (putative recombinase)
MSEPEKEQLKKWIRTLKKDKDLIHDSKPDYTISTGLSLKKKFDGYLFYGSPNGIITMPYEAKARRGGKNYSVKAHREGRQGHQITWLVRFLRIGATPFICIFWQKKKGCKWYPKILKVTEELETVDYVPYDSMPEIYTARELVEYLIDELIEEE